LRHAPRRNFPQRAQTAYFVRGSFPIATTRAKIEKVVHFGAFGVL